MNANENSAAQQAKALRELQALRARERKEAAEDMERAAAEKAAIEKRLKEAEEKIQILEMSQTSGRWIWAALN